MSQEVHHPVFARLYSRFSPQADARGAAEHRQEVLDGLSGRVLELGAGNGLNFPLYPPAVSEVIAIEPEDYLRDRAHEAAAAAHVPVTVVDAVADRLPFPDSSFDAAVASLVLCSVPDEASALAELRRVVKPGGELRFYEHVRPNNPRTAVLWQRLDDWNIYPRISGGCHAARDTESAIRSAGFEIEQCRRFPFKGGPVTALRWRGVTPRRSDQSTCSSTTPRSSSRLPSSIRPMLAFAELAPRTSDRLAVLLGTTRFAERAARAEGRM